MTRRERLERKVEKREEWGEKARERAEQLHETAHEMAQAIPFGQPILVGHHSEQRDRNYRGRIEGKFRKSFEEADKAKHHEQKAEGLAAQLDRSIFSDDDNAIEALEERIKEREEMRERMKAINATIRKHKKAGAEAQVAALMGMGHTDTRAREILKPDFCGRIGIPDYELTNLGASIRKDKERVEYIKRRQAIQAKAEASPGGVFIKHCAHGYCYIVFAEKPERSIIHALKDAGFRWSAGGWYGHNEQIPASVHELLSEIEEVPIIDTMTMIVDADSTEEELNGDMAELSEAFEAKYHTQAYVTCELISTGFILKAQAEVQR